MKERKKTKKVKAWAIVSRNGICETISNTGNAKTDYWMYFAHSSKAEAVAALKYEMAPENWKIVPCTITYSLPH